LTNRKVRYPEIGEKHQFGRLKAMTGGESMKNFPHGLRRGLLVLTILSACLVLPARMARAQPDGGKPGVVSHVLVLSDKCEDVSSPDAWQRTYIKPGMTDQDRALAIWRTVVRYRHQTNPPNEFLGPEINVHDPLKTIHVYGVGMCCCASSNVCGLARYL
jgi:hypothetical protein